MSTIWCTAIAILFNLGGQALVWGELSLGGKINGRDLMANSTCDKNNHIVMNVESVLCLYCSSVDVQMEI